MTQIQEILLLIVIITATWLVILFFLVRNINRLSHKIDQQIQSDSQSVEQKIAKDLNTRLSEIQNMTFNRQPRK